MKVLVLGSLGTVGRSVSKYFKEKGHQVLYWDIKLGAEYDLRVPGSLNMILQDVDFVVHLAFDVGGSKYNIYTNDYINNNIDILRNTFASLEKYKKPFIYSSSQMSSMNNNAYAVLKKLSEIYTSQLDGIAVRLWNVYGSEPVNEKSHVIPDFIDQAISSDIIQMRTTGSEERQFLYCEDCAAAIYTLFENYTKLKSYKVFDLSTFQWTSIKDVANLIKDIAKNLMNKDVVVVEGDYIDTFHSGRVDPNVSELTKVWTPNISLKNGLEKIFQEMLDLKNRRD